MRTISIIIFLTILSCSDERNTSLKNMGLKGDVVKIYESHFDVMEKGGNYEIGEKRDWNAVQSFDANANINYTKYTDNEGDLEGAEKYIYDNADFLVSVEYFRRGEQPVYKLRYENNESGNPMTIVYYNDSNKITSTVKLAYQSGKVKSGESIDRDGYKQRWENKFKGDLFSEQITYDSANNILNVFKYKYDDNDFLVMYAKFDRKDSLIEKSTYEYSELDKKNNWIKRLSFENGKPKQITVRRIFYKEDLFIDAKTIIGIWTEVGNDRWLEFKSGERYHTGYREEIRDMGEWELINESKTLTFESDKPEKSKKYTFEFDGEFLIFYTLDGDEEKRFVRR